MTRRIHPEELHDWRRDHHRMDRPRQPLLIRLAYAALIANTFIWFGVQAYLTVDYILERTAVVEVGQ